MTSTTRLAAAAAALALLTTACSDATTSTAPGTAAGQVCPERIVSQLSWFPDPTHAAWLAPIAGQYVPNTGQLAVGKYTVDKKKLTVTGMVQVPGNDKPVTWEVRSGGPATAGQSVASLMYADKSILLGQQATEEQIVAGAAQQPTVAVLAPIEFDPVIYAWDNEVRPDWNNLIDIGKTDEKVYAFQSPSTEVLTRSGKLRASQMVYQFDGTPSAWLAGGRKGAIAGFSTGLLWNLRNLAGVKQAAYVYVSEGYPNYRNLVTVTPATRGQYGSCLRALVPLMQRASIAFAANPTPVLDLVVKANQELGNPEPWPAAKATEAARVMKDDGLLDNGKTKTFGDMDTAAAGRIERMVSLVTPTIRSARAVPATELATNDYVDPTLTLPTPGTR